MIRGIIFDLDMCILDTRTLTGSFFDPVLLAVRASRVTDETKVEIESALLTTSLEDVISAFPIPEEDADAMRHAYRTISVPPGIRTFGDEEVLRALSCIKVLVTSGYEQFQREKIEQLGIAPLFDDIRIDSIDDPLHRKGKKQIFKDIMEEYAWSPDEVLVVGDNPLSELGAAQELGIQAVQTLRPSIQKWEGADMHITSLRELTSLLTK